MKPIHSPGPSRTTTQLPDEPKYKLVQDASGPTPGYMWERPAGVPHSIRRTASGRMTMAPRALLERDPALLPGYLQSRVHNITVAPLGTLGTELGEPIPPCVQEEATVTHSSLLRLRPAVTEASAEVPAAMVAQPLAAAPGLRTFNVATWANLVSQAENSAIEAQHAWTAEFSAMQESVQAGRPPADIRVQSERVHAAAWKAACYGQIAWDMWQQWLGLLAHEGQPPLPGPAATQEDRAAMATDAPGRPVAASPPVQWPAGGEPAAVDLEQHLAGRMSLNDPFPPALQRGAAQWYGRMTMACEEMLAGVRLCEAAIPDWGLVCMRAGSSVDCAHDMWAAWFYGTLQSMREIPDTPAAAAAQASPRDRGQRPTQGVRHAAAPEPDRGRQGGGAAGPDQPAVMPPPLPSHCGAAGFRHVPVVLPQPAPPQAEPDPGAEFELLRHPEMAGLPLNEVLGKFCPPGSAAAQRDWSAADLFVNSHGNDVAAEVSHLLMRAFSTAAGQAGPPTGMRAGGEALSLMQSLQALAERLSSSEPDRRWLADLVTDANATCDSRVGVGLGALLLASRLQDLHRPGTLPTQGLHTLLLYAATRELEARIRDLLGQQAEPSAELLLVGFHRVQQVLQQEFRVPVPAVFPENILHDPADSVHLDAVQDIAAELGNHLFRPYADEGIRHPLDELKRLLPGERILALLRRHGGEDFERFFQAHHGHDVRTKVGSLEEKWEQLERDSMALTSKDYLARSEALKQEHGALENRVYSAAINRVMAGYGTGWSKAGAGSSGHASP